MILPIEDTTNRGTERTPVGVDFHPQPGSGQGIRILLRSSSCYSPFHSLHAGERVMMMQGFRELLYLRRNKYHEYLGLLFIALLIILAPRYAITFRFKSCHNASIATGADTTKF